MNIGGKTWPRGSWVEYAAGVYTVVWVCQGVRILAYDNGYVFSDMMREQNTRDMLLGYAERDGRTLRSGKLYVSRMRSLFYGIF